MQFTVGWMFVTGGKPFELTFQRNSHHPALAVDHNHEAQGLLVSRLSLFCVPLAQKPSGCL